MNLIHRKHLNATIMKVGLQKAYNCLDLGYLRLVLHKICLQPRCVAWIMACVTNVNYAVIINGYPTQSFQGWSGTETRFLSFSTLIYLGNGWIEPAH